MNTTIDRFQTLIQVRNRFNDRADRYDKKAQRVQFTAPFVAGFMTLVFVVIKGFDPVDASIAILSTMFITFIICGLGYGLRDDVDNTARQVETKLEHVGLRLIEEATSMKFVDSYNVITLGMWHEYPMRSGVVVHKIYARVDENTGEVEWAPVTEMAK